MLLVKNVMTREVVTVGPETTAAEALALCRERHIRHLPVLEGGRMVGMISDRDLRSATPVPGDPGRPEALRNLRVGDALAREVATAHPEDPIEDVAAKMYERKIGSLPVMDDGEDLVGIVTSSDVMRSLVRLLGADEPGSRVVLALSGRPAAFAGVAGILNGAGVNIVSVMATSGRDLVEYGEPVSPGERVAVFRIDTINPARVVESLRRAGYAVLWPPVTAESMP